MLVAVVPDLSSLVNKPVAMKELMEMEMEEQVILDESDKSIPWLYLLSGLVSVCSTVTVLLWKGKGRR